jgi:hypothetical protein
MPQCELEGRPSAGGYPEHNDLVDPQRVEERQMGIGLRCG